MFDKDLLKLYRFVCKNVVKPNANPMYRNFIQKYHGKELTATDKLKINDYITLFSVTSENTSLLERYRIGVERDTISHIETISRRVGLNLPKLNYTK